MQPPAVKRCPNCQLPQTGAATECARCGHKFLAAPPAVVPLAHPPIWCPRCGAQAPWGAPMCPACQAPFVAPPGAAPQGVPALYSQKPAPDRSKRAAYIAIPIVALIFLGCIFAAGRRPAEASTAPAGVKPANNILAMQSPATPVPPVAEIPAEQPESSGIFRIERQRERAPIIAIVNDTDYPLRFQTWDTAGRNRTQWIDSYKTSQFSLPEGYYRAYVDSPYDKTTMPAQGEVNIRDFHHYQADFVYGNATDPSTFYIGD